MLKNSATVWQATDQTCIAWQWCPSALSGRSSYDWTPSLTTDLKRKQAAQPDTTHNRGQSLLDPLPPGKRSRSVRSRTNSLRNSFYLRAVAFIRHKVTQTGSNIYFSPCRILYIFFLEIRSQEVHSGGRNFGSLRQYCVQNFKVKVRTNVSDWVF